MGARAWAAALLGVVLATGPVAASAPARASAPDAAPPVRVAVVGDSLAQGSSGDWTWRYFLHRHLLAGGADVDLVGSRSDLHDVEGDGHDGTTTPRGDEAYADPEFDRDHESRWSRALSISPEVVPELMATHAPDVLVLALGFNDLAWWGVTPEQLVGLVHDQVEVARQENPSVRVVVSELMVDAAYWGRLPVDRYNRLLRQGVPGWSTPESRVSVARRPADYRADGPDHVRDTWDGVHPDTSGQVKIASAVATALAEVGVGVGPDPRFRAPVEGLRSPSTLVVDQPAGRPTVARLTWRGPPGATGHDVWMARGNGAWRQVAWGVASGRRITGLTPGGTYRFKVVALKYLVRSDDDQFSVPVRLTVPTTTLSGLRVRAGDRRLGVSWAPTVRAQRYRVQWRRTDVPGGWRSRTVTGTAVALTPLVAGAPYRVRVTAVTPRGTSRAVRSTQVRGPQLRRVTGVSASARRSRVSLTWLSVPDATHYRVERRVARGWTPLRTTVRSTRVRMRMKPGRHVLRVRALHQEWSGAPSRRVVVRVR